MPSTSTTFSLRRHTELRIGGVMDFEAFVRNSTVGTQVLSMSSKISGGLAHDMPADLAVALTDNDIISTWETLTPIGRNEFICWIEDAKQEKTRAKRIIRAVDELLEGKKRPCCWAGCIHRTDKKPSKWQQDVLIDKKKKVAKKNETTK